VIAAQNGAGKTTLMDAITISLYGYNGFLIRHQGKEFHDWLRAAYSVESDNSENIQFIIDVKDPIMGIIRISRTYWLIPESEGGVEEEVTVTIEGKPLQKEGNESRNKLCERWIEDYLPIAAVRRSLVDGEKLNDLNPSKIDSEIISGIDDTTGIGLLHKMVKRLRYVKSKTLRSLAPENQKDGLEALLQLQNDLNDEYLLIEEQLFTKTKELECKNNSISELQEDIEQITRMGGAKNVELRMDYAIKQSELTSSRKDINEMIMSSLPFLLAGLPSDLSSWNFSKVIESKREQAKKLEYLEFLQLVLEQSGIKNSDKDSISSVANNLLKLQKKDNLNAISSLPLIALGSIQEKHLIYGSQENHILLQDTLQLAMDRLENFEQSEKLLRDATSGLGITEIANQLKELAESVGGIQASLASLRGKYKKLDEEKRTIEIRISNIKQNEDEDSLLNRRIRRIENLEILIKSLTQKVRSDFGKPLEESFAEGFELLSRKSGRLEEVIIDTNDYSTSLSMRGFKGNWLDRDLSATEKQHVGLSLLYALRKASTFSKYGLSLPVVIDTPTSRMDIEHKGWSVTRFYPSLSNQVIVFATSDDLANGLYDELIDSKVLGLQLLISETSENSVEINQQQLGVFFGGVEK
jgi:DNA sulfur modification protein DndD